jgi:hypothetical protein
MLHGWDNFYITAATAGATLIGLLFVVVSLGSGLSASSAVHGVRAFVTPTLAHFGNKDRVSGRRGSVNVSYGSFTTDAFSTRADQRPLLLQ